MAKSHDSARVTPIVFLALLGIFVLIAMLGALATNRQSRSIDRSFAQIGPAHPTVTKTPTRTRTPSPTPECYCSGYKQVVKKSCTGPHYVSVTDTTYFTCQPGCTRSPNPQVDTHGEIIRNEDYCTDGKICSPDNPCGDYFSCSSANVCYRTYYGHF